MSDAAVVLFDIDGTLVDSNYLHIQAWSETLAALGAPINDASIHRALGMDANRLLEELLGDVTESVVETAKAENAERYGKLASRLRPFDGARELLKTLSGRGLKVVLATSAPPAELADLLKVLDSDAHIAAATSADDVETAKPEPDLIKVALAEAGVTASRAMMVGDAVWDGVAAAGAGVPFIGVMSGGMGAAELKGAGAIAVYDDVAQLLRELDSSPLGKLLSN